jgi:NitT/TauT family transport system ATP-binding protein
MAPIFEARNLRKVFGQHQPYVALDRLGLEVREGEFLCLLGASGCGKSTLLNILAGFESASEGEILYRGKPIRGPGKDRVMFFQDSASALLPWLTVEENVAFGLRLQGIDKAQRTPRVERCLALVGLSEHRHKYLNEISGGMRQRMQIARALAIDPDVFLMDEPFAALDAITRRRMHEALLEVWAETRRTVVFVTHDILEALTLADRIAIMSVGPASHIYHIIDVGFERPRDPTDPGLGRLFKEAESVLNLAGGSTAH